MKTGWIQDTMESQRLCAALRLQIFFEVMDEARLGPGHTDTNLMMESMDGREFLGRIIRRIKRREE
jgi:hypothetical protein